MFIVLYIMFISVLGTILSKLGYHTVYTIFCKTMSRFTRSKMNFLILINQYMWEPPDIGP